MNKSSYKIVISVAALAVLLVGILWMAGTFNSKVAPGLKEPEAVAVGEPVGIAERVQVNVTESVPATIRAQQTTNIASRILARIQRVNVRAGAQVEQGQLLVQLEDADAKARVEQAQSQMSSVSARLKEARSRLNRVSRLFDDGLVAIAEVEAAQADFDDLTAQLERSRQALKEARATQAYTQIRAPIAGRIVDRLAEPGDTVSAGQTVLSLYNPASLRVEAQVREALALDMMIGQKITVDVPSKDRVVDGSVEEMVPAAEPGSRSFLVKVAIANNLDLLPGMYARLIVPVEQEARVIVPVTAVGHIGQLAMVWVKTHTGTERRLVRLGQQSQGHVHVTSGLSGGETLLEVPAAASQ
ncbi:Multidrug resistance protein MdtA [BD1-7 clade bacterium]|uniref:Multidrug resistance protein MdtA n=1 Tax=BD1-7 clade bacterium TaxID=2029982 RepID=A0A5S9PC00_9GAMM|nr:Multidrug resistance protein MdtA [BD1-7 clade bacterium]CAA0102079.1 Multidrug resistance protein MdtA [BD1-7 clade bacterium]